MDRKKKVSMLVDEQPQQMSPDDLEGSRPCFISCAVTLNKSLLWIGHKEKGYDKKRKKINKKNLE